MIINTNGVNVDTNTQRTDAEIKNLSTYSSIPTYLTLVGNVNVDMVNASLGMNNEDTIKGVGKALAMYGRYYNSSLSLTTNFANLVKCDTLSNILSNANALKEALNNTHISTLVMNNNYAKSKLLTTLNTISKSVDYNTSTDTISVSVTSAHINKTKFLVLDYSLGTPNASGCTAYIKFNGVTIANISYNASASNSFMLNLADYGITTAGTYSLVVYAKGGSGSIKTSVKVTLCTTK